MYSHTYSLRQGDATREREGGALPVIMSTTAGWMVGGWWVDGGWMVGGGWWVVLAGAQLVMMPILVKPTNTVNGTSRVQP